MKKKFIIEIASVPDREHVVAEVWFGEDMIAEINQESEEALIEFYNVSKVVFDLHDFLTALQEAKRRLLGEI